MMLKELFTVSRFPDLQPDISAGQKASRIFKTYGLVLLALILIGPLLVLADKLVKDVLHHKSLTDTNKHQFQQLYHKLGKAWAMVFICLIGPIFEELIFRLWLNFKKRYIVLSAIIALCYFGMGISRRVIPDMWLPVIIGLSTGALLTYVVRYRNIPADATLQLNAVQKYRLIVVSMVAFALMHIGNYRPVDLSLFWIYPVFVLPQLLMGWGITYVRFKNGFGWGVAMHVLINTLSMLLALWTKKF